MDIGACESERGHDRPAVIPYRCGDCSHTEVLLAVAGRIALGSDFREFCSNAFRIGEGVSRKPLQRATQVRVDLCFRAKSEKDLGAGADMQRDTVTNACGVSNRGINLFNAFNAYRGALAADQEQRALARLPCQSFHGGYCLAAEARVGPAGSQLK